MKLFHSSSAPFLLLASSFVTAPISAQPVASSIAEIERRWFEGESEATIHASQHAHEASPAWPVVRDDAEADSKTFAYAPDERTMRQRQRQPEAGLWRTVWRVVSGYPGDQKTIALEEVTSSIPLREEEAADEAPVLRPRGGIRYRFDA